MGEQLAAFTFVQCQWSEGNSRLSFSFLEFLEEKYLL